MVDKWRASAERHFEFHDAANQCFMYESLILAYYELLVVMSAEFK